MCDKPNHTSIWAIFKNRKTAESKVDKMMNELLINTIFYRLRRKLENSVSQLFN